MYLPIIARKHPGSDVLWALDAYLDLHEGISKGFPMLLKVAYDQDTLIETDQNWRIAMPFFYRMSIRIGRKRRRSSRAQWSFLFWSLMRVRSLELSKDL